MAPIASKAKSRTRLIAALLAVAGLLLVAAVPARAEVVYPPGRRVGLEPLPGMRLEPTISQFVTSDGRVSITVLELPPPAFPDLEKGLFAEVNEPGVTVLKRETFPFASGIGYYAAVRVTANGLAYRKWVLLSVIPDLAALVSVEMPEDAVSAYPEDLVRRALASVTFRPPPTEERLATMPFVISEFGGFTVTDVLPGRVLLKDPEHPNSLPRLFIVVGSGAPNGADERARFAYNLIQSAPLPNAKILSGETMRIRGMPGFEIKAQSSDPSGAEVTLVQWLSFSGGGYLMIVAAALKDDWERLYPRFRAIRDGIQPR